MPQPGLYTKSKFTIWSTLVEGQRWNLRIHCLGCKVALGSLEPDEQPYIPDVEDLTWFCGSEVSLVDIAKLYTEPVDSLSLLDGVDNVPTRDKKEVQRWLLGTTACPMSGPSHTTYPVWTKVGSG